MPLQITGDALNHESSFQVDSNLWPVTRDLINNLCKDIHPAHRKEIPKAIQFETFFSYSLAAMWLQESQSWIEQIAKMLTPVGHKQPTQFENRVHISTMYNNHYCGMPCLIFCHLLCLLLPSPHLPGFLYGWVLAFSLWTRRGCFPCAVLWLSCPLSISLSLVSIAFILDSQLKADNRRNITWQSSTLLMRRTGNWRVN